MAIKVMCVYEMKEEKSLETSYTKWKLSHVCLVMENGSLVWIIHTTFFFSRRLNVIVIFLYAGGRTPDFYPVRILDVVVDCRGRRRWWVARLIGRWKGRAFQRVAKRSSAVSLWYHKIVKWLRCVVFRIFRIVRERERERDKLRGRRRRRRRKREAEGTI